MVNKPFRNTILILLVLNLLAVGYAAMEKDPMFSDEYAGSKVKMDLIGYGIKKFLAIKVVGAALYLPEGIDPQKALEDKPKRLEVVYLQNIPKVELDRATTKGIRKNFSKTEYEELMPKIEELNTFWPSVQRYDRIGITYTPDVGMEIDINGDLKGKVEGRAIAHALFSVWLGEKPADGAIKNALLGKGDDSEEEQP